MNDEPKSDAAVSAWIEAAIERNDPFREVALASERHREEHGCDAYHSSDAPLLGTLAAAAGARRILEIGGALGYSAFWLAHGAGPGGVVETIESDAGHAELIRAFARQFGLAGRVRVIEGEDATILPDLTGPYDLVFYDAFVPGPETAAQAERLLRRGGTFVASNVFLGRYAPDLPELAQGAAFRERILDSSAWLTAFANGKLLAVRQ